MSDQQQQSEAETRDDGGEPEINVEAEQQAETTTSSTPAAAQGTEAKDETKPQEQEQTQEELDNELEKVNSLLFLIVFFASDDFLEEFIVCHSSSDLYFLFSTFIFLFKIHKTILFTATSHV